MSQWARSSRDRGKAPAIVPSRVDSYNNDDDTVLASLQVVRTLQRHFDRRGDDTVPSKGMHITHHTRS